MLRLFATLIQIGDIHEHFEQATLQLLSTLALGNVQLLDLSRNLLHFGADGVDALENAFHRLSILNRYWALDERRSRMLWRRE